MLQLIKIFKKEHMFYGNRSWRVSCSETGSPVKTFEARYAGLVVSCRSKDSVDVCSTTCSPRAFINKKILRYVVIRYVCIIVKIC